MRFYQGKAKLYHGKEWKWWIARNSHLCKLCDEGQFYNTDHPCHLGLQAYKKNGLDQTDRNYWKGLYQTWIAHVKQYHKDWLEEDKK